MNGPRSRSHNARRHEDRVAQITRLDDRAELTELIFRVGLCLDEHRFADLADLFVEDGVVVTPSGAARGRAALIEHAMASNAQFDRMQHVTTNVLIDFDPVFDPAPDATSASDPASASDPTSDPDPTLAPDSTHAEPNHQPNEHAAPLTATHARIRANIVATFCQGADPHPVAVRGGVSLGKAIRTPNGWRLTELEARPTWAAQPQDAPLHAS